MNSIMARTTQGTHKKAHTLDICTMALITQATHIMEADIIVLMMAPMMEATEGRMIPTIPAKLTLTITQLIRPILGVITQTTIPRAKALALDILLTITPVHLMEPPMVATTTITNLQVPTAILILDPI